MAYKKMDPTFKKKWVEALRSGKYKQGQRYLRTDDGYCCLGVACAVARKRFTQERTGVYSVSRICSVLPTDFQTQIKLSEAAENHLIKMNDQDPQKNFDQIADWIERNL